MSPVAFVCCLLPLCCVNFRPTLGATLSLEIGPLEKKWLWHQSLIHQAQPHEAKQRERLPCMLFVPSLVENGDGVVEIEAKTSFL